LRIIVKVLFCEQLPERIDSEYDDFDFQSSYPGYGNDSGENGPFGEVAKLPTSSAF
jgi:hypothetical protein